MGNLNKNIGERIKALRINLKISREKLGELAEISDRFIYDIENGNKGLSADTLLKISNALGVTSDYLLTGISNNRDFSYIEELISKLSSENIEKVQEIVRIFVSAVSKNKN